MSVYVILYVRVGLYDSVFMFTMYMRVFGSVYVSVFVLLCMCLSMCMCQCLRICEYAT